jgi:hypothetical protein
MLPNLPKPQVSPLPKVRWLNRVTQVKQFFLSQPIQIPLNLPNLTKCSQHLNTCLTKCGMPKVRLWQVRHASKHALNLNCHDCLLGTSPTNNEWARASAR